MNKKYRRLGECCAQQVDEVRRAIIEIKKRVQQEAAQRHADHDQELLEQAKGQENKEYLLQEYIELKTELTRYLERNGLDLEKQFERIKEKAILQLEKTSFENIEDKLKSEAQLPLLE